ncbi:MAG: hypothetical protein JWO09_2727 [Bacteroidetes bacterium]|nr:hypothetical protein [Bacteroidota bacterium]
MKPSQLITKPLLFSFLLLASCAHDSMSPEAKEKEAVSETEQVNDEAPKVTTEESSAITAANGGTVSGATLLGYSSTLVVDKKVSAADNVLQSGEKIPEKIKKTADINLTVNDYKIARAAVAKIVAAGNGYISGENEQNTTYNITNSMIIRVPNRDFDAMVGNITAIDAHVNSKNIYTEDVTAQFVDITARLKSKKEVEKRYLDLLQKAAKVTDILEVEEQLRMIREEIEAKEGELKYLNDQVNYSTINLSLHQDFEFTPQDSPGFFGRMATAFGNGWNSFLGFIVGIMYAWPLWIILAVGGYFLYRYIKKHVKK